MKRYKIPEIKLELNEDISQIPDKIRVKLRRGNLEIMDSRESGFENYYTGTWKTHGRP